MGILSFASSANVEHSLSDNQDAGTLQKALERVLRFAGSANTLLAFNEAQRQINVVHSGKQHKRRQVLVFASNGQYPCKKRIQFLIFFEILVVNKKKLRS